MNALVIARDNVLDRRVWSGTTNKMYEALHTVFGKVFRCDCLGYPSGVRIALENRCLSLVGRSHYWRARSAQYYAKHIQGRLKGIPSSWHIAISIDSFLPLGALHLPKPVIYISDCTKTQLVELEYPGYAHISKANRRLLMKCERAAYERCDLLVFGSKWAADSVVSQYGIPLEKVRVIPYGANLDEVPDRSVVLSENNTGDGTCKLLFLGVQWDRKGGDTAVAVTNILNAQGLRTELTVCGCEPPHENSHVRVVPFLDKHRAGDRKVLNTLLSEASYLIVPTKADCSPIVFCEAFAYGLPVITCAVGGVPEIVTHAYNGVVLSRSAPAEAFAATIAENYLNKQQYWKFRGAARDAYEKIFNWKQWAKTMHEVAQGLII